MKTNDIYRSPIIHNVPKEHERLIDTGMLHYESSVAGYNERYHRGETSHTIHVWWARRPHSAMRSLLFSSLCRNNDETSIETMANLAMNCNKESLTQAKNILKKDYQYQPKTLDMFGGGGTIPFEAKRLGFDSYSIDSNQLSVFIQRCNMVYANKIDLKKAEIFVKNIGEEILNNLLERTDWLYPLRQETKGKTFGYIWTYKTKCPHCGKIFYLSKRPWLSKKNGKKIAFVKNNNNNDEKLCICDLSNGGEPYSSAWEKRTGILRCPKCKEILDKPNVIKCQDVMIGLVSKGEKTGKVYTEANQDDALPNIEKIKNEENRVLTNIKCSLPSSKLPVWSGIVNPALYGIETHADFLNFRQRLVLLYLIDELIMQYDKLVVSNVEMAKFVIGSLSSLIDQVVDWNCRLSMWIPQNEQVGRAFCGPGIAMLFDYCETDMLLKGPANLWDKLKRIINGVKSFEGCIGDAHIYHAHAQDLPFESNYFDAIVTDPPYYDNIYYSILADFFYSWKKILLKKMEPDLFKSDITDYKFELVASSRRVDTNQSPHDEYCKQLNLAFSEAARVLKEDGIFSFVYSHSSVNAWEAVAGAYRQSPFIVTSVQPLSIERKGRPRAVMSQAVNTCVTFVARKINEEKKPISLQYLLNKTEEYAQNFGKSLIEKSGWTENDAGLAVIACTVGLMANASSITGNYTNKSALISASKIVKNYFPDFSIKVRDSI
ncbi:DUF1156 domain-containing protein [Selenomonas sp. AE3005]|uniref:DUF1156 domain-containing protein n=1 Tax=Selenomonas sp. AE3005 TaxID=1485543 RepID=UPI000907C0A1|nr:DUF1156 domain-containing protein [Selenomonas sp. AE3005]